MLRTHALDAGLDPEFTVLDEHDDRAAAAGRLRRGAGRLAAQRARGRELIAAYGPRALRGDDHGDLRRAARARRARADAAARAADRRIALDLRSACLLVEDLALAVQRELGAAKDPGARVLDAIEQLERAPAIARAGLPWPGELERLRLGNGAGALKSQACDDYREALAELRQMAAETVAGRARATRSTRCCASYGERYTAAQAAALGAGLRRPRAARARAAAHARRSATATASASPA